MASTSPSVKRRAQRAVGAYLNGAGLALAAWKARGEDERPVKADLGDGLRRLIAALVLRK